MASSSTMDDLLENIDVYNTLILANKDTDDEAAQVDVSFWRREKQSLEAQVEYLRSINASEPRQIKREIKNELKSPGLATRKRFRDAFDDDVDDPRSGGPPIKSRRSTPVSGGSPVSYQDSTNGHLRSSRRSIASPAPSVTDSIASDFFDNVDDEVRQDARKTKEKLKQEREDEMFARQLQQKMMDEDLVPAASSSQLSRPLQQYNTQVTFRPDGSFAPRPTQSNASKQDSSFQSSGFKPEFTAPPTTSKQEAEHNEHDESTDSDGVEEIGPSSWNQRFPTQINPARNLPLSFSGQMPGAFPNAYTSTPGQSVYGSLPGLPDRRGLSQDSSSNPYSVDNSLLAGAVKNNPYGPDYDVHGESNKISADDLRRIYENIRPDEDLSPDDPEIEDLHSKMKIKLMPHQKKGLTWMKKMEDGGNKGGILADDMGLGKTIQAIALMLSRPDPQNKYPTLIVCPVSLMEQWKRELEKLIVRQHRPTVVIFHTTASATATWDRIKQHDVILTSYGKLGAELKKQTKWQETLKENPAAVRKPNEQIVLLHEKAKFHRIFLDEAQAIKNKSTLAAHGACRLNATYRWCLTGTPMQNGVEDIYSLIKFCRISPYNSPEKWARDIGRPLKNYGANAQDRALQKLQALLKAILLRRDKKSTVDGKPILQLPAKHKTQDRAILKDDELKFYKALETQSKLEFNRFLKNGTSGRFYSHALVLLLRLRQCCCSPQLIINSAAFLAEGGDVSGLDMVANARSLPAEVRARLKEIDQECPICYDATENPIIFNPCGHCLCHDCFSRMVDSVHSEASADVRCPNCRATIHTAKITDLASFKDAFAESAAQADDETASEESASDSETDWDEESDDDDDGDDLKDFVMNDDEDLEFEEDSNASDAGSDDVRREARRLKTKSKGKKPAKSKGKKRRTKKKDKGVDFKSLADLRKEGLKSIAAKKKYLKQLAKIYEPCAKIDKTLELLHSINTQNDTDKAIVFSSFTSFLDMVEVPLSTDPAFKNYTRYDGSMTAKARNEAVLRFQDDPECRVMLVSLKAGNSGLNLTVANHVLLLDPFWNPFVEYQAADRCHRIGQQKEVFVHNVVMGEEGFDHDANPGYTFTVEDRILQLQEQKRQLVEAALDENAASGISRLGLQELGFLFGVNSLPAASSRR